MTFAGAKNKLRSVRMMVVVLSFSVVLTGCLEPSLLFSGAALPFNFHELDSGKAYRSAQPRGDELESVIDVLGIKTVINLRGPNPEHDWYNEEVSICQAKGVYQADYRMSAASYPTPEVLKGIVGTLKTAEYPILIHCQGGSDRTGAVSAIYRMLITGDAKADALQQLSVKYFHFRCYAPVMDMLAEMYEPTDEWLETYTQEYPQLSSKE
jgi:protein tyrosine/serine phosphatase